MVDLARFRDRPFLLLLESYVLHALGDLPESMEQLSKAVALKFFGEGNWREQLEQQVGLPDAFAEQVKTLWAENQKIAKDKGVELIPAEFAQALVDANFAEVVEMVSADLEAENPRDDNENEYGDV